MVFGQLGAKLAQKDLEGTADWAESMPANDKRTSGKQFTFKMDFAEPQQAANWASQIQDSDKVQAMKV